MGRGHSGGRRNHGLVNRCSFIFRRREVNVGTDLEIAPLTLLDTLSIRIRHLGVLVLPVFSMSLNRLPGAIVLSTRKKERSYPRVYFVCICICITFAPRVEIRAVARGETRRLSDDLGVYVGRCDAGVGSTKMRLAVIKLVVATPFPSLRRYS